MVGRFRGWLSRVSRPQITELCELRVATAMDMKALGVESDRSAKGAPKCRQLLKWPNRILQAKNREPLAPQKGQRKPILRNASFNSAKASRGIDDNSDMFCLSH